MSRRIAIELTSRRSDGTWTWRAAGAREPKGVIDSSLVPEAVSVNDVLRADVETDLDGTRVLAITPPKAKAARTGLLEFLPSDKPFEPVTQKLQKKGPRGGKGRDGRRPDGPRERRPDDTGERRERPKRPFFETPPELPQRPKPKRIRPGRANVDAVLAELPEAQRAIAEKVIVGGVPAVRSAVKEQNTSAAKEGREQIPTDGIVAIAEQLLPRLRVAEWRDRAAAAERILEDIDLRDLRSIVVSADTLVAPDEETRQLTAKMKQALVVRQESETKNWLDDIETATSVGRVVRALRLSSQPPKAGVPFPAALAAQLVQATVAGMTPDAPADRWIALLEAAAFSPIRTQVLPAAVPPVVAEELLKTVNRLGPLMPQVAALFGVVVDPKARPPRPLQQQRDRTPRKRASDVNASQDRPNTPRPPRKERSGQQSGRPAVPVAEATTAPSADETKVQEAHEGVDAGTVDVTADTTSASE